MAFSNSRFLSNAQKENTTSGGLELKFEEKATNPHHSSSGLNQTLPRSQLLSATYISTQNTNNPYEYSYIKLKYPDKEEVFKKTKLLGSGAYGQVFKFTNMNADAAVSSYAVKQFHSGYGPIYRIIVQKEAQKEAEHASVVLGMGIYTTCSYQNTDYIVEPFIEGACLSETKIKSSAQFLQITLAIFEAVNHLHSIHKRVHRDLHMDNIIINFSKGGYTATLIDFGLMISSEECEGSHISSVERKRSDSFKIIQLLHMVSGTQCDKNNIQEIQAIIEKIEVAYNKNKTLAEISNDLNPLCISRDLQAKINNQPIPDETETLTRRFEMNPHVFYKLFKTEVKKLRKSSGLKTLNREEKIKALQQQKQLCELMLNMNTSILGQTKFFNRIVKKPLDSNLKEYVESLNKKILKL